MQTCTLNEVFCGEFPKTSHMAGQILDMQGYRGESIVWRYAVASDENWQGNDSCE